MCPGRVHQRNDFIHCDQNIIQSKANSLKWLESDSAEVTLTLDALRHPADILERNVKDESMFFQQLPLRHILQRDCKQQAHISAKVRVLFTGRH